MINRAADGASRSSEPMMTMFPQRTPHGPSAASKYLAPLPPPQHSKAFASTRLDQQLLSECRSWHRFQDNGDASSGSANTEIYKQLWLKACSLPIADVTSVEANSSTGCNEDSDFRVWRNFSTDLGLELASQVDSERSRRTAVIAECYPVRVPPPSCMGSSSLAVYLDSTLVGRENRSQQLAQMRRAESRVAAQLAAWASVRRPSLDALGRIKPPPGYKQYPSITRKLTKPDAEREQNLESGEVITAEMQPDLFGKLVKKRPPRLWKLSYRSASEAKRKTSAAASTVTMKKQNKDVSDVARASDCVLAPSGIKK